MADVANGDDVIDSRDVIDRIDELEYDRDNDPESWDEVLDEELDLLKRFADDGESLEDWQYGCTLVRETYFQEYAQDLADELGLNPEGEAWPANCIDWEQAARELQMDYTPIDFDGVTYYGR